MAWRPRAAERARRRRAHPSRSSCWMAASPRPRCEARPSTRGASEHGFASRCSSRRLSSSTASASKSAAVIATSYLKARHSDSALRYRQRPADEAPRSRPSGAHWSGRASHHNLARRHGPHGARARMLTGELWRGRSHRHFLVVGGAEGGPAASFTEDRGRSGGVGISRWDHGPHSAPGAAVRRARVSVRARRPRVLPAAARRTPPHHRVASSRWPAAIWRSSDSASWRASCSSTGASDAAPTSATSSSRWSISGLLMSQPTDTRDEFADVFDFDQAFEREYPWCGSC